jgi:hypothetical protein
LKITTESPELDLVGGAKKAVITITRVPCGLCYTTAFYDEKEVLLRQDQHVVVEKGLLIDGVASLVG